MIRSLCIFLIGNGWRDSVGRMSWPFRLAEAFWPGPLTLVIPRRDLVPDLVTAGQTTVALRMSAHPVFEKVSRLYGKPIAAPSANRFGRISPTTASHVLAELGGRIPLIVDGGPCVHGIESTIVRVREQGVEILRHGPITSERLSEFGIVVPSQGSILAPGSMESHYAPNTRLIISAHLSRTARGYDRHGRASRREPAFCFGRRPAKDSNSSNTLAAGKIFARLPPISMARCGGLTKRVWS